MKLIFVGPNDVHDAYGKLSFGANGLRDYGRAAGLRHARTRCVVRRPDGSYDVYGYNTVPDKSSWWMSRYRTFDGLHYEAGQEVLRIEAERWLGETDIAYNSRDDCFLCLKWKRGDFGHALWAFGSKDGSEWEALADRPVYHDHDAFGLRWDERIERYVCYQQTYQPWQKRYEDNIGNKKRRVMHIRTSADGVHWEPSEDVPWKGPYMPEERLFTPDAEDPEELEFYRFTVFRYGGRYVGMMLNYAPSPHPGNPRIPWSKHGPQLSGEWWISADGQSWERPFREVFAPGEADGIITHEPMAVDDRLLWVIDNQVCGLPEDRIFFVGSMANAEFSTPAFEMVQGPIVLNAALCYHDAEARGMQGQAYIMAELLDADGTVIEDFEKGKCVIQHMNDNTVSLRWGDVDGSALAGKNVRLRLYLRDARIYSVTVG